MRELKFRGWRKSNVKGKQMVYDIMPNEDGFNDIMQFTGLLDKQGKEIYEGDICKIGNIPDPNDEDDNEEEYITEIWFDEGKFLTRHYGFPVSSWAK